MNLRFLDGKRRFALPMLVVVAVRSVYGLFLYMSLRRSSEFYVPFMQVWGLRPQFDWLYLFSAWDSVYYLTIAKNWYQPLVSSEWAFFPLYPAASRIVNWIIPDITMAAFVVSTISGLAAMVLYQLIAEYYTTKRLAMQSTLIYFLLPPMFVFSMVNYSESLFLLMSLLTWKLHLQEREFAASLLASLAALTKPYGLIIALPLTYHYLRFRQFSKLRFLAVPSLAFIGWLTYGEVMTGSLIPRSAWHFWRTENTLLIQRSLTEFLMGNLESLNRLAPFAYVGVVSLVFLLLFAIVASKLWKIDHALLLYVAAAAVGILGFGSINSFRSVPRLFAFLFPLGLPLYFRRKSVTCAIIAIIIALDYLAWLAFLTDGFY